MALGGYTDENYRNTNDKVPVYFQGSPDIWRIKHASIEILQSPDL